VKISLKIGQVYSPKKGVRCVRGGIALGKIGCALEMARTLAEKPGTRPPMGNWLRDAEREANQMRRMFPKASAHARALQEGLERWKSTLDFAVANYEAPRLLEAVGAMERSLRALAKESLGRCGRRMAQDEDAERLVKEGKGAPKKARPKPEPQAPPTDLPKEGA